MDPHRKGFIELTNFYWLLYFYLSFKISYPIFLLILTELLLWYDFLKKLITKIKIIYDYNIMYWFYVDNDQFCSSFGSWFPSFPRPWFGTFGIFIPKLLKLKPDKFDKFIKLDKLFKFDKFWAFGTFGAFCTFGTFDMFGIFDMFGMFGTFGTLLLWTLPIFWGFGKFGKFGKFWIPFKLGKLGIPKLRLGLLVKRFRRSCWEVKELDWLKWLLVGGRIGSLDWFLWLRLLAKS